ncbi:hypothetical protein TYRP_020412 [Tyrophagus putrescentiae]|nr:hypothetical protein TYRP_020412 [Tyrophagus putrescentiae]
MAAAGGGTAPLILANQRQQLPADCAAELHRAAPVLGEEAPSSRELSDDVSFDLFEANLGNMVTE